MVSGGRISRSLVVLGTSEVAVQTRMAPVSPGSPTSIPIPGYQVMLGGLYAYLGGRVSPIAPESLEGFVRIWPYEVRASHRLFGAPQPPRSQGDTHPRYRLSLRAWQRQGGAALPLLLPLISRDPRVSSLRLPVRRRTARRHPSRARRFTMDASIERDSPLREIVLRCGRFRVRGEVWLIGPYVEKL